MSAVVGRAHGGDVGGDPPPGSRRQDSGCLGDVSRKTRGKNKNLSLRDIWKFRGRNPLEISFDLDQESYMPLGPYSKKFIGLVGIQVRKHVPYLYDSWDDVPEEHKRKIWPTLRMYFDLQPHLESDEGDNIRKGIHMLCADRYKGAKNKFKTLHYISKGGAENEGVIREQTPPNMTMEDWGKHIDFYKREKAVHRAKVNQGNRAKLKFVSKHGTKSIVQHRYEQKQKKDGITTYPSLITGWRSRNTNKNGQFENDDARKLFADMENLQRAQVGNPNPMSEEMILEQVLGTRRGFNTGRGRIVKAHSSSIGSTSQSHQPIGRVYTQEEVDKLFVAERERSHSQMQVILQTLNSQGIPISFPDTPTTSCTPSNTHTTQNEDEDEEDGDEEDEDEEVGAEFDDLDL